MFKVLTEACCILFENCSESVVALLSSKSQVHKQLQKMLLVEQQLSTDIKDTQTVVAGELAAIRKHVQLVRAYSSPVVGIEPCV